MKIWDLGTFPEWWSSEAAPRLALPEPWKRTRSRERAVMRSVSDGCLILRAPRMPDVTMRERARERELERELER